MKRAGEKETSGGTITEPLSQGLVEQAYVQTQTLNQDLEEVGTAYSNLKTGACATNPGLCAEHPHFEAPTQTTAGKLQRKAKKATDTYADTMRRWSAAVRNYRVNDLTHQVQDFARQHPALLLGGALIAGFALTRALKITGTAPKAEPRSSHFYEPTPGRDMLPAEEDVFHS